ncbi:hypothetical protein [Mycobacterium sp. 1274761.0]|uniref:hypothetical protein n=1 Tax=Mycobacterium sp. 1274761.0 TaxID=1834077 RepID=UPI0007FDC546|nr:hypothetical protein [Mycobacterium sp. 1274761.0]OBK76693.1 hypothetical protein A5651_05505 [Mycobacterium sp. 1274761.0]
MRTAMVMVTAAVILAASGAVAWAEPTAVPEVPGGGRVTEDPSLVDVRPLAVDSWSRARDANAVAVNFTSGAPTCSGVHADVHETADDVTVALQAGTLPDAVGRMCIMLAVFGTLEVPLSAPLGDRRVLNASAQALDKPR